MSVPDLRKRAAERFRELGFPSTHEEEWRYTNVAPIARADLPLAARNGTRVTTRDLEAHGIGADALQLVFVDGWLRRDLCALDGLPRGVRLLGLAEAMESEPALVDEMLASCASYQEQAFTAWNTAHLLDGAVLAVPRGVELAAPVHFLFLRTARGAAHPRNLISLGEGAKATVVETYAGAAEAPLLTNAVTEIRVGANAQLDHVKLQREPADGFHVGSIQVRVDRDTRFSNHNIVAGGALVRNDVDVVLDGENVHCTLNGLCVLAGAQHVDNHTSLEHRKPHGESHELYKSVLRDKSVGVFRGKIHVFPHAQKTDAKQSNANLLLSPDATADSKPQLEIYADDVKCTHGATVGQLDREALFYLRSRGVAHDDALALLVHAFAADVTRRIPLDGAREIAERWLAERLPGGSGGR